MGNMGPAWNQSPTGIQPFTGMFGPPFSYVPPSFTYPSDAFTRTGTGMFPPAQTSSSKASGYPTFLKEVFKTGLTVAASLVGGLLCMGNPLGAVAAGSLVSGLVSAADQQSSKGRVDWGSVGIDTLLGAFPGLLGGKIVRGVEKLFGKSVAKTAAATDVRRMAWVGATDGAVMGYVGGAAQAAYEKRHDGKMDWSQVNQAGLSALLPGMLGGALAGGGVTMLTKRLTKCFQGKGRPMAPLSFMGQASSKPTPQPRVPSGQPPSTPSERSSQPTVSTPSVSSVFTHLPREGTPASRPVVATQPGNGASPNRGSASPRDALNARQQALFNELFPQPLQAVRTQQTRGSQTCHILAPLDAILHHPQGAAMLRTMPIQRTASGYQVRFPGQSREIRVDASALLGSHTAAASSAPGLTVLGQAALQLPNIRWGEQSNAGETLTKLLGSQHRHITMMHPTELARMELPAGTPWKQVLEKSRSYRPEQYWGGEFSPYSERKALLQQLIAQAKQTPSSQAQPLLVAKPIKDAHYLSVRMQDPRTNQERIVLGDSLNPDRAKVYALDEFLEKHSVEGIYWEPPTTTA